MKINEIEPVNVPVEPKGVRQSPWDVWHNDMPHPPTKQHYLGTGIYGAAYGLKDQHSVVKVAYNHLRPADNDPYMIFIDYAVKNQDNPFLPRLQKIKKFAAGPKPGSLAADPVEPGSRLKHLERHFYYIHMEKLFSINDLTFGQIQACMNTYFANENYTETTLGGLMTAFDLTHISIETVNDNLLHHKILSNVKHNLSPIESSDYSDLVHEIINRIPKILRAAFRDEYAKYIKDLPTKIKSKLLIKTIDELKQLIDVHNTKIRADIHYGNIMYRITPYGVQPVITDPFAG